jgi:nitrite reductase (NADH) small subunit
MSELRWHPIGRPDALRFEPGARVLVDGLEIAVFPLDAGYVALVDSCPHAGGPLSSGLREGRHIECPWHGWSFDLATGACTQVPSRHARCVAVRLRDGQLELGLPIRT